MWTVIVFKNKNDFVKKVTLLFTRWQSQWPKYWSIYVHKHNISRIKITVLMNYVSLKLFVITEVKQWRARASSSRSQTSQLQGAVVAWELSLKPWEFASMHPLNRSRSDIDAVSKFCLVISFMPDIYQSMGKCIEPSPTRCSRLYN